MMTCSNSHLCLKFAHVANIVFQFWNLSHNNIGGQFNVADQFSQGSLTTLDLSYNNISGDISTLKFCEQAISGINGPLCDLQIL
jgi:hypothetical protein